MGSDPMTIFSGICAEAANPKLLAATDTVTNATALRAIVWSASRRVGWQDLMIASRNVRFAAPPSLTLPREKGGLGSGRSISARAGVAPADETQAIGDQRANVLGHRCRTARRFPLGAVDHPGCRQMVERHVFRAAAAGAEAARAQHPRHPGKC